MKRIIVLCMLLMSLCVSAQVQTTSVGKVPRRLLGIEVHFRFDKSQFDMNYMGNAQALDRFAQAVDSIGLDRIDSVVVVSQSSPEGAYKHNLTLSHNRAATMHRVVLQRHPELEKRLHVRPDGESWEGLRTYVANDKKMKPQTINQVLRIIDSDVNIDTKKWRLQQLPIYRYLLQTHYPRLRNSVFCIVYFTELPPVEEPVTKLELPYERPKMNLPSFAPISMEERRVILALKTNLLYDALTLLNYSIEVPFNEKFSVLWYHQFPWWRWGEADNQYCIRFLSIGAEGRWWFNPKPRPQMGRDKLMGHFVGLYAESGKWDFEWGRDICHQGEHWSVGLSYGYSMPLGRRLNMEFSISVGYASIAYRKYEPSEDYEILWRDPEKHGRWHYFGPTKAQVSLVVPITMKTKRKGGAR